MGLFTRGGGSHSLQEARNNQERHWREWWISMWVKGREEFPGGSGVKNPPAVYKTRVRSLSREDPLEEEMATHSSILAWKIPWTEEPGGLESTGSQVLAMTEGLSMHAMSLEVASFCTVISLTWSFRFLGNFCIMTESFYFFLTIKQKQHKIVQLETMCD